MTRVWIACALLGCSVCEITRAKDFSYSEDPVASTMQDGILQLDKTRSVLRFPVAWGVLRKIPDVVTVEVKWIENPTLAPVMLAVYFEAPIRHWEVGAFTLYPPDHPGVFKFRITDIVKDMLARASGLETQPLFFCVALRQARSVDRHGSSASELRLGVATPQFDKVDAAQ